MLDVSGNVVGFETPGPSRTTFWKPCRLNAALSLRTGVVEPRTIVTYGSVIVEHQGNVFIRSGVNSDNASEEVAQKFK